MVSRWRTNGESTSARSWRPDSGPLTAFATGDDERPGGGERSPEPRRAAVAADVEDQVIALAAVGEVLPGVVDDLVGADRADQAGFRGAGHPSDLGAEGFGELHGVGTDASRGTDNQDVLPGPDMPGAQALQGGITSPPATVAGDSPVLIGWVRMATSPSAMKSTSAFRLLRPFAPAPSAPGGRRRGRTRARWLGCEVGSRRCGG